MAGRTVIKPFKLKPTGEALTRDDLFTWKQILLGHIRQNPKWLQFLPSSATHKEWKSTDENVTNGLDGVDATASNVLRADFQDFLTCVATYSPTGFGETILRESTSFDWVIKLIQSTHGLETKGEHFLALDDMKLEYSASFTYQQGLMQVKDFVIASMIKEGAMFEGKKMTANEVLTPTVKNFIVREFLFKTEPRLPKHVKETRGHLFTEERPTLACNQKILCDQIPTMLAELDSKADHISQGNVAVGFVPTPRGRGGSVMMRGRGFPRPYLGTRAPVIRPMAGRAPAQYQNNGCFRCLGATPRRYDAAKTHQVRDCTYPPQPHQQAHNVPGRQMNPNFKVVFFNDDNRQQVQQQQPLMAAVDMGQGPMYQQDEVQAYYEDYYYDEYYQHPQQGATITELSQPPL